MTIPEPDPPLQPHLSEDQVLRLIEIIEAFDPIVVGGQAINLWVQYYRARQPSFPGEAGAFTSKDLDFYKNMAAARALADALGGKLLIPGDDDATPNAALVVGMLDDRRIEIDFMASILGVDGRRIAKNYVMIEAHLPPRVPPIRILLLHPLDCVCSRLSNINILHRDDAHSTRQASAAIRVLQAFLDELLDSPERQKHVQRTLLDLSYVVRDLHKGKPSHLRHRLKPEAVLLAFRDDERLDERWRRLVLQPSISRVNRWLRLTEPELRDAEDGTSL